MGTYGCPFCLIFRSEALKDNNKAIPAKNASKTRNSFNFVKMADLKEYEMARAFRAFSPSYVVIALNQYLLNCVKTKTFDNDRAKKLRL